MIYHNTTVNTVTVLELELAAQTRDRTCELPLEMTKLKIIIKVKQVTKPATIAIPVERLVFSSHPSGRGIDDPLLVISPGLLSSTLTTGLSCSTGLFSSSAAVVLSGFSP